MGKRQIKMNEMILYQQVRRIAKAKQIKGSKVD